MKIHYSYIFMLATVITLKSYAEVTESNKMKIKTDDGPVIMTESSFVDGGILRTYTKAEKVLYKSKAQFTDKGFIIQTIQGHPSQLGSYELKGNLLKVENSNGKLLWEEELKYPICPAELAAEFVKSYWNELNEEGKTVQCVIPIIKAKKVAPVKWVKVEDDKNGNSVIELRPDSFGMRFFLKTTRFVFSRSGDVWISQQGQFESTKDPGSRAKSLKGKGEFEHGRIIQSSGKSKFGVK